MKKRANLVEEFKGMTSKENEVEENQKVKQQQQLKQQPAAAAGPTCSQKKTNTLST